MKLYMFTTLAIMCVPLGTVVGQSDHVTGLQQHAVQAAAAEVANGIVQVETLGGRERVGRVLIGSGPTSGLIVSPDGYIVSSAFNFIQEPSSILVTLPNGQRHPAKIVARDRSRMLVLLKIQPDSPLVVPVPAPRSDLRVGQTAIALGKTYDAEQVNLSVGILSAINRIWGKAVQTDANVSPSNYGGPLIDLHGHVIGILVPLSPQSDEEISGVEWYDSGIGFAVPLEDIYQRLDRLKSGDDLLPGKLGFAFEGANELDGETIIAVVKPNSPAAKVGLKPGDRLVAVNGTTVQRQSQVRHVLGPLYAGDRADLKVVRDDQTLDFETILTDQIPPYEHAFLGILPQRHDSSFTKVRFVYADSPAAKAGLQAGDTITQVDDQDVSDADRLRTILAMRQPSDSIKVSWRHDDEEHSAEVKLTRLPESVPDALPEPMAEAEIEGLATGKTTIEIPEEPNACTAYVPESIASGHSAGLLVMLVPPGSTDVDALIAVWRDVCEARHLVLLLPEARDRRRWQPPEAGFVRKAIDQAIGRFDPDEQRIVVLGEGASGAMAYLVGLRYRDIVRGIAAVQASPPQLSGNFDLDQVSCQHVCF